GIHHPREETPDDANIRSDARHIRRPVHRRRRRHHTRHTVPHEHPFRGSSHTRTRCAHHHDQPCGTFQHRSHLYDDHDCDRRLGGAVLAECLPRYREGDQEAQRLQYLHGRLFGAVHTGRRTGRLYNGLFHRNHWSSAHKLFHILVL